LPIELIDREIKHGLCHLTNRGIIPRHSDLSQTFCGPASVLNASHMALLPHQERFTKPVSLHHLKENAAWRQAHLDALQSAGAEAAGPCALNGSVSPDNAGDNIAQSEKAIQQHPERGHLRAEGASESAGNLLCVHAGVRVGPAGEELCELSDQDLHQARKREFEQLMDDHSAHMIIIRKGKILEETPEFESYKRTYAQDWVTLAAMLLQLESICVQYAVPLATVDGKRLAEVCHNLETNSAELLPVEQLLVCIENIQEVAAVLRQPGRRFAGPDGRTHAATTIQSHIRGYLQHKVSAASPYTQFETTWPRASSADVGSSIATAGHCSHCRQAAKEHLGHSHMHVQTNWASDLTST
jgi:IQ domain-containing protein H